METTDRKKPIDMSNDILGMFNKEKYNSSKALTSCIYAMASIIVDDFPKKNHGKVFKLMDVNLRKAVKNIAEARKEEAEDSECETEIKAW